MKTIGSFYVLKLVLGNTPDNTFCCSILISRDINKLEKVSAELEEAIRNGFESTVKFFEELGIHMPMQHRDLFNELYRGGLFEASTYVIDEI